MATTTKKTPRTGLAAINRLRAEGAGLRFLGSDSARVAELYRQTAALAGRINPPADVTLNLPAAWIEDARKRAARMGLTLGQFYTFILSGTWEIEGDATEALSLLDDMRDAALAQAEDHLAA